MESEDDFLIEYEEARVPLGATLAAELGQEEELRGGGRPMDDEKTVSPTPINHSPESGWTGVLDNDAGPSRPVMSSGSTEPTSSDQVASRSVFAEQFKYLICSSGLLEKDYVPGLSSGLAEPSEIHPSTDLARNEFSSPVPDSYRFKSGTMSGTLALSLKALGLDGSSRRVNWDVLGAAVVLILALVMILGIKVILTIIAVSGCLLWRRVSKTLTQSGTQSADIDPTQSGIAISTSSPPTPQKRALDSLEILLAESRSIDSCVDASLILLQPHAEATSAFHPLRMALHCLTDSMTDHLATATSLLLGVVDKNELAVLGEMYDIPVAGSFLYSRTKRDTSDDDEAIDADALPSSSTTSRPLGTIPSPRRPSHHSDCASSSLPPLRKRLSLLEYPSTRQSIEMSSSHSMPNGLRSSSHTHHLSLVPSDTAVPYGIRSADDRFTNLPPRTPRISKRTSWTELRGGTAEPRRPQMHERRITEADEGDASDDLVSTSSSGESSNKARKTPYSARQSTKSPSSPVSNPSPRATYIPRMGSPSNIRSRAFSPHSPPSGSLAPSEEVIGLLPSAFDSVHSRASYSRVANATNALRPNNKRRSLQNMPYYHSDDTNSVRTSPRPLSLSQETFGLSRTLSMGSSAPDLQRLRSRLNDGGICGMSTTAEDRLRRRQSIRSIRNSGGSPVEPPVQQSPRSLMAESHFLGRMEGIPRPSRVASISPLTLQALKAACLGIHLKRRRMACCLLGLRFIDSGVGEEYWDDVVEAIEALIKGTREEREKLEMVRREAEKETKAKEELEEVVGSLYGRVGVSQNWTDSPFSSKDLAYPNERNDYAPRTGDLGLISGEIDLMQDALVKAWKGLGEVRRTISSGCGDHIERDDVEVSKSNVKDQWMSVREELGSMLRGWERGKEIISRIENRVEEVTLEPRDQGVLPDFMKTWIDDGASAEADLDTSTSTLETDHPPDSPLQPASQSLTEILPLPGMDVVHEAEISLGDSGNRGRTALARLSREQRIELMKVARERGVSLVDMLNEREGGGVEKVERRIVSGQVVEELKGVIGIIRRMKETGERGLACQEKQESGEGNLPTTLMGDTQACEPIEELRSVISDGGEVKGCDQDWRKAFIFPARINQQLEEIPSGPD